MQDNGINEASSNVLESCTWEEMLLDISGPHQAKSLQKAKEEL